MYSNCGLVISVSEEHLCSERKLAFVRLDCGLSFVPLEHPYIFLEDGDLTESADLDASAVPTPLLQLLTGFSRVAYIEAMIWGGTGMQASLVAEAGVIVQGPEIAPFAINAALRRMGVDNEMYNTFTPGKDPFDRAGLGRHRSVEGWLEESKNPRRPKLPPEQELERRRPVWDALSSFFLDTELDQEQQRSIAKALVDSGYTSAEIQAILWDELYPVLHGNLRSPAGEWAGFDLDWLQREILSGKHQLTWWSRVAGDMPLFGVAHMVRKEWQELLPFLPPEFRREGN